MKSRGDKQQKPCAIQLRQHLPTIPKHTQTTQPQPSTTMIWGYNPFGAKRVPITQTRPTPESDFFKISFKYLTRILSKLGGLFSCSCMFTPIIWLPSFRLIYPDVAHFCIGWFPDSPGFFQNWTIFEFPDFPGFVRIRTSDNACSVVRNTTDRQAQFRSITSR